MSKTISGVIAGFSVTAFVVAALAAGGSSVEQGKTLFNSTTLGTNNKSCNTCHPEGKKLEEAATADEKELEANINQCILNALKGSVLKSGSPELTSMVLYLKTLGSAKTK